MMKTIDPDESFPEHAFSRDDESDDRAFFSVDRMVSHLDSTANESIRRLIGSLVTDERPRILDLMASWDSHLPPTMRARAVTGLGLNENELRNNQQLTDVVLHDLNADPVLPFADRSFDAVLCTVSVDYLTRPAEIFSEVRRVLEPGGLFLVIFSNRFFPEKVVAIWRESSEDERVRLVERYFELGGGFTTPRAVVSKGKPRPDDDRYAHMGLPSDPVYAVFAEREGGAPDRPRRLPPELAVETRDPEQLAHRRKTVGKTLTCPHCGSRLKKWEVPQTPFTEYDTEFMYVCFDDRCPFLVGGWDALSRQGNHGFSCRFMYDPDRDVCLSVPVPSLRALRESIVEE